jgi:type I restriction-modification system DNA methylase subunit
MYGDRIHYVKMATNKSTSANLGFEQKLWQAADKLRSNMDAAEYKHVCAEQNS